MSKQPVYEQPWPLDPSKSAYWYHTTRFPDGEVIEGSWDIPGFSQYIGGYDLKGKTVLDVGTASGYLAFNAELAGAEVTGLDAATTKEFRHFPYKETLSYQDIAASQAAWTESNLDPIKRSWWYCWHKYNSKAKCVYAPHQELYEWPAEMFDVVQAGAIIEHLSDPVYSVGAWARLAREAVLLPWTEAVPVDDLRMIPITPLDDHRMMYVWWHLSRGLWIKLFDNLGFDVHFAKAHASMQDENGVYVQNHRPSIIAIRRGTNAARTFDASTLTSPWPAAPAPDAAPTSVQRRKGLLGRLRDL